MASNSKQKELHNQTDLVPWCQCNNPPQHLHIYCNCGRRLRCVCKQCKHTFLVQNWKDHKERCGRIQQRKKIPPGEDVASAAYSTPPTFTPLSTPNHNNSSSDYQEHTTQQTHQNTNISIITGTPTNSPFHFSRDSSPFSLTTPKTPSSPLDNIGNRSPQIDGHAYEKTITPLPLHNYSRPFEMPLNTLHNHQQNTYRAPPFNDTFNNQFMGFTVQRDISPRDKGTQLPSITPHDYTESNVYDPAIFASSFGLMTQISSQIPISALKQPLKTEASPTSSSKGLSDNQGFDMFPKYGPFKMHTKVEVRMPYMGEITRVVFDQKPVIVLKNEVKRDNQSNMCFLTFLSPIEYQHGEEDARRVEVTVYVESTNNTEKQIHSTEMYFLYMADHALQTLSMRINCFKLLSHFDSELSRMRVSGPGISWDNFYNFDQSSQQASPTTSPQSSPSQRPHSPVIMDSRDDSMQYSLN